MRVSHKKICVCMCVQILVIFSFQKRWMVYYRDEIPLEEISTQNLIWTELTSSDFFFPWANENYYSDAQTDRLFSTFYYV